MSNTVIESKTYSHHFGLWPASEKVKTTMNLMKMPDGMFCLSYVSKFSGIKDGHVSGGPYEITGNVEIIAQQNPKVLLQVSGYHKTASTISMNVSVIADIPVMGTHTIYSKSLCGTYSPKSAGPNGMDNLSKELSSENQKIHTHV